MRKYWNGNQNIRRGGGLLMIILNLVCQKDMGNNYYWYVIMIILFTGKNSASTRCGWMVLKTFKMTKWVSFLKKYDISKKNWGKIAMSCLYITVSGF